MLQFLFKKYNVLIFKPDGRMGRMFKIRGFVPVLVPVLFIALTLSNVFLCYHFSSYGPMMARLKHNDAIIQTDQTDLLVNAHDFFTVSDAFSKIKDLNFKLSIMLGLEEAAGPDESFENMGGSGLSLVHPVSLNQVNRIRFIHRLSEELEKEMRIAEIQQQKIQKELVLQRENLTRIPSIWPARGRFSSPFGYRRNPFTHRRQFHKGIDISAPRGTPIHAPAAGVVTYADWFSTYGRVLEITHQNGLVTRYAHLSKYEVKPGTKVQRGDLIALVGNTGRSIAPHLHYEVHKNGKLVNPMYYIMDN